VKLNAILLTAIVAIALAGAASAQPAVRIDSTIGLGTRIPIAVPPFATSDPSLAWVANEMAEVVAYDLEFSGLFSLVPKTQYPTAFTGFPTDVNALNLDIWRGSPAERLVFGFIQEVDGQYVGQFRLFDLFSKEQIVGQELRADKESPRRLAHRFSEEVIRYLDGTPGIGTSEIWFSAGQTGKKEIWIADYDGANARQLTSFGAITIKPKVSPDGTRVAFISYKDRFPFLYVYDRRSGETHAISKESGLNSAPTWSPDGNTLAMTLSKDANTEIYLRNADGSNPRRLTNNRNGDTSPTFSSDGRQIAFVSDRGGNPQIYVMDSSGGNAQRLSFQGGSSYDPVYSPDGKYIAYVVEKSGEGLEIYIMINMTRYVKINLLGHNISVI